MKKWFCLLLTLALLPLCVAYADSAEDALLSARPGARILTSVACNGTAVSVARVNGRLTLFVQEKQGEQWEVVLSNPNALLQDEAVADLLPYIDSSIPTLLLDSVSICWAYGDITFSSFRRDDGTWGPVNQVTQGSPGGDGSYLTTALTWQADAQELNRNDAYYDADGNFCWTSIQHVPAPWLTDCIQLADFDVSRYPVFIYEEYDGQWPDDPFIREAAAYLMPDWTLRGGSYTSDECFRFLMERNDGRCVFVGVTRDLTITVSAPMPDGTYFGVENFTNWFGCGSDSFFLSLNPDGKTWGLAEVMSWRESSEDLTLTPTHIYHSDTCIVIGAHPWSDVTTINWATLPTHTTAAYQQTDSSRWVIVRNPDPADRLHLRSYANRSSDSKGKYYTGTPAKVLGVYGDWVEVNIAGRSGYMMKKYLEFGDHLITTAEYMPEFRFKDDEGKLYALADRDARTTTIYDAYGWRVIGILGDEWYHVWHPQRNEYRFVLQEDVALN